MKKITLFTFLFLSLSISGYSQETKQKTVFGKAVEHVSPDGYIRCATSEYEKYLQENNPKRATSEQFENWLQPLIAKYKHDQTVSSQNAGIIYIPVVVHVIHNGDAYGASENITDEQVQSQMTVMTQDYRRMLGTPGYNTTTVGADTSIEFVLAKVDPNGNPTNGIDRVNLCQSSWSTTDINGTVKPTTIWDPTQYMNMWSVNFADTSLLGYAQFPDSSGIGGLNASGGLATTDGVVAGYGFFGSSALATGNFQAPYDRGRTMTHEVGHFLGLLHTFQGGCGLANNSTSGDYCADTPGVSAPNFGCVAGTDSCTTLGLDMIANYMDYTDDTCMNIFTQNQKDRMVVIMNNSPRRASLKTSVKDVAISLFANDAELKIENSCGGGTATCASPNPLGTAKIVSLYNRGAATLTAATISYSMNGGTVYTNNWTGSLAPNKYAYITLANTAVNGTLNVAITSANGGADQRASNNTASKTFGSTFPYANATTFTFNLIGDSYGSETSWTLSNQAGTPLYSGGPYTDIASGTQILVNNQTWTLPANGCYYLTMNDSWGDGLYNGAVQGSYTVTAGATTVLNITNFNGPSGTTANPVSKISYFTNNAALNSDSFDLTDITLYPNPSKNFFTIDIPQSIERTGKMEIYNTLGQLIVTKTIASDADLTVNTSSLTNGVYFLNLNLGDAVKTLRFIKE